MPEFDSSLLLSTLRRELRAAWATIHDAHAEEQLYGFGVYTTESASYLNVTAFSEAGLARVAAAYLADPEFAKGDPELMRQSLRWSPCDSPLHEVGARLLPQSDDLVQALDEIECAAGDDAGEPHDVDAGAAEDDDEDVADDREPDDYDRAVAEVFRVAVQALQELDREGLFGVGEQRERLVLCVWQGDQSDTDRYDFAKALNPPAVTKRFGEQMNDGTRAYYRQHLPEEEPPEDEVFE